ncbi:MAG: hypothetical protein A3G97_05140 [Candidatus Rokubacteria bacterium RIFCSPLOWO2_12_FULL_69_21]|nr:MAG: hypothetical protein A3G97_05140 [Candidatus Rokubacteria bacterium RIFCSPLOWO2_12_FULL_69_21]
MPDMPMGCPSAIAPPQTLTRPGSRSRSRRQASIWAAKASLISTKSNCLTSIPSWPSSFRVEATGAIA